MRPRTVPLEGSLELREGLRALGGNPFFKLIADRLRVQRYALEAKLKDTRFDRVEDVHFVQSGVY